MAISSARARLLVVTLGFVAALASGACRNEEDTARTKIRVLDSTYTDSWAPMEDTGIVYRIEVVSPFGADTVRNVIPPAPTVVGDTLVLGLVQVSEDSSTPQRQIFRLRLGQHRIETQPLPDDVWPSYQDVLISPDGRYVAYVGEDTTPANPGMYAIVREIKTGRIVVRGPGGGGCDCDEDFNHARWFPPDSFEIAVAHSNTSGNWQRLSGKASASRIHVDTLSDEPDWH
ncbi:MAG TPA: hypothetical protein VJ840_03170 [Gemmatimonadaceae bacterium]|nr:hypothetical protein [Gemmatimonadaceae bacterium]